MRVSRPGVDLLASLAQGRRVPAVGGVIPSLPGPAASLASSETEMKAIDAKAESLLSDFRTLPATLQARIDYERWFSQVWKPFFTRNTALLGQFSNILRADALAHDVEARRTEMASFDASFQIASGRPGATPMPGAAAPSEGLPAWVLVLGAVAVVGGGYLAARWWYDTTREKEREIRTSLLESELGRRALSGGVRGASSRRSPLLLGSGE